VESKSGSVGTFLISRLTLAPAWRAYSSSDWMVMIGAGFEAGFVGSGLPGGCQGQASQHAASLARPDDDLGDVAIHVRHLRGHVRPVEAEHVLGRLRHQAVAQLLVGEQPFGHLSQRLGIA
jgi:hypothetical protein